MKPRIVCAANKAADGTLLIGARHWDHHMIEQANALGDRLDTNPYTMQQGFIDQRGNFYTREEAYDIAEANGQIIREVGNPGERILWSENLY